MNQEQERLRPSGQGAVTEDSKTALKRKIDYRLNEALCGMKPEYDDSITGFNAAWEIVDSVFKDAAFAAAPVNASMGEDDADIAAAEAALAEYHEKGGTSLDEMIAELTPRPASELVAALRAIAADFIPDRGQEGLALSEMREAIEALAERLTAQPSGMAASLPTAGVGVPTREDTLREAAKIVRDRADFSMPKGIGPKPSWHRFAYECAYTLEQIAAASALTPTEGV